jgi:hypothetical protein
LAINIDRKKIDLTPDTGTLDQIVDVVAIDIAPDKL